MATSTVGRLAEKFYYDFSLHKRFLPNMAYNKYVALRHNLLITGGFFFILSVPFPFVPAFPTMGLCPKGWEGSFVCEPDKHKALDMYKAYRAGKKYEEPAAAPAHH
ncbi:F1F0 ATP synthase associated 12.0kDa protein [Monoraphidium neglectum]|uniref:F1F0 ATP synthase associated 12.0kDa protein n=1 Tax=Monoraphidium neglectum TaxID=145388 RepID=A0A0D2NDW4_9CHLO|nr:F1F0 ATP synthase associated 12.0kDa protein [Monoraphidium neglectum]KIZ03466.1 F1F0 ATP synthase associated 12.0kDa protein [Monoraphidium neglectum]|eukprot:XP_013902485.1 F1F0 ATP synthase associated 12.0kDa protein [Monoraphidium neglectum]